MTPIHVVSAADEGYAPHLGAMLHSLFESSGGGAIHVHFLHRPALPAEARLKLHELCRAHGAAFTAVAIPDAWVAGCPAVGHYSAEAWFRTLLARALPDLDRVLWLDADLLVLAPLHELWDTSLEGQPLAAARNALIEEQWDLPQRLGMRGPREGYFNTGVMLLDLAQLRRLRADELLLDAATRLQDRLVYADQDAFNPVFADRCKALPLRWNVIGGTYFNVEETIRVHGVAQFRAAIRQPAIVHFTRLKPWLYERAHPYSELYLRHRAAAGYPPPAFGARSPKEALWRFMPFGARMLVGALLRLRIGAAWQIVRALA